MQFTPGLSLLLFAIAVQAEAAEGVEPAVYSRESRQGVRAILLQNMALERTPNHGPSMQFLAPGAATERRQPENIFPDPPAAMGARLSDAQPLPSDSNRRSRALSAEERRTLRRQIDEVGHDIYAPRR